MDTVLEKLVKEVYLQAFSELVKNRYFQVNGSEDQRLEDFYSGVAQEVAATLLESGSVGFIEKLLDAIFADDEFLVNFSQESLIVDEQTLIQEYLTYRLLNIYSSMNKREAESLSTNRH